MHLKNKTLKKYSKQIDKLQCLSQYLYQKDINKFDIVIKKTYLGLKKYAVKTTAGIIYGVEDGIYLEAEAITTKKALKRLKNLLIQKIEAAEALKQERTEFLDKLKLENEEIRKKEILKKDVAFWMAADAAEKNEQPSIETTNNPALSSTANEPEQLSLPFTQENSDERLAK